MRNITNIDVTKTPYELGYINESKCNNEILLNIRITSLDNPYLEITKPDGTIANTDILAYTNNELTYTMPIAYIYDSGNLLLRVRAENYDSEYITFNIPEILTSEDDIIVKIEDNNFLVRKSISYKYSDLPLATKTSSGVIIIGNNLNIDSNGVLSAVGGEEGTTDYNELINKPKINGVELEEDKSTTDLGISYTDLTNKPTNVSTFTNDAGYLTEIQSLTNLEIESLLQ